MVNHASFVSTRSCVQRDNRRAELTCLVINLFMGGLPGSGFSRIRGGVSTSDLGPLIVHAIVAYGRRCVSGGL